MLVLRLFIRSHTDHTCTLLSHFPQIGDVLKASIGVVRELVSSSDEEVQIAKNKLKLHIIEEVGLTFSIWYFPFSCLIIIDITNMER